MNLNPIENLIIEKLLNYSDNRVRIAWELVDEAVGYNIYASFSQMEVANKVNIDLIIENFFDVIPPEAPIRRFYIWLTAVDVNGVESNLADSGASWEIQDLESGASNCEPTDNLSFSDLSCDCAFGDTSTVYWPRPGSDIYNEVPDGDKDDVNVTFSTRFNYQTGTLRLYKDGSRVNPADITEVDQTSFDLSIAPGAGDVLIIDYKIAR